MWRSLPSNKPFPQLLITITLFPSFWSLLVGHWTQNKDSPSGGTPNPLHPATFIQPIPNSAWVQHGLYLILDCWPLAHGIRKYISFEPDLAWVFRGVTDSLLFNIVQYHYMAWHMHHNKYNTLTPSFIATRI